MQFVNQVKVMGVAFFAGNIDGKELDSGTLFIEEALDETSGRAKGFRTVEYKLPNSDMAKALTHNAFPMNAEVKFETKVTKGSSSIAVIGVKPVNLAKAA